MVKSTEKRAKEDGEQKPLTDTTPPSHIIEGLDESNSFQSIPLQEMSTTGHDNHGFQDDVTTPVNGSNNHVNSENRVISRQDGRVWLKSNTPPVTIKNTETNLSNAKQIKKDEPSDGKTSAKGDTEIYNLNTFGRQKIQSNEKNNVNGNHITPKLPTHDDIKHPNVEPVREYYIPVNTHRKLLRGEKLYLTHDKRSPNRRSWRKIAICGIVWTFIAVICITAALAATGVILSKPMQIDSDDRNSDYSQWTSGLNEDNSLQLITIGTDVYPTVDTNFSIYDLTLKVYKGTMKLERVKFDEALTNPKSPQFLSLSSHLENKLFQVYQPLSISKVRVENFRAGSVWADFFLAWEYSTGISLSAETIDEHLKTYLNSTKNYLSVYLINSSAIVISAFDGRKEETSTTEEKQPSYFFNEPKTITNTFFHFTEKTEYPTEEFSITDKPNDTSTINKPEETSTINNLEETSTNNKPEETSTINNLEETSTINKLKETSTTDIPEETLTTDTLEELSTVAPFFIYHLTTTNPSKIEIETESTSTESPSSTTVQEISSNRMSNYGRALDVWNITGQINNTDAPTLYNSEETFISSHERSNFTSSTIMPEDSSGSVKDLPYNAVTKDQGISTETTASEVDETITYNLNIFGEEQKHNTSYDQLNETNFSTDYSRILSTLTTQNTGFTLWPNYFVNESNLTTKSDSSTTLISSFFDLFSKKFFDSEDKTESSIDSNIAKNVSQIDDITSFLEKETVKSLFDFFTTSSTNDKSSQETTTDFISTTDFETSSMENQTDLVLSSNASSIIKLLSYNSTENYSIFLTTALNNESLITENNINIVPFITTDLIENTTLESKSTSTFSSSDEIMTNSNDDFYKYINISSTQNSSESSSMTSVRSEDFLNQTGKSESSSFQENMDISTTSTVTISNTNETFSSFLNILSNLPPNIISSTEDTILTLSTNEQDFISELNVTSPITYASNTTENLPNIELSSASSSTSMSMDTTFQSENNETSPFTKTQFEIMTTVSISEDITPSTMLPILSTDSSNLDETNITTMNITNITMEPFSTSTSNQTFLGFLLNISTNENFTEKSVGMTKIEDINEDQHGHQINMTETAIQNNFSEVITVSSFSTEPTVSGSPKQSSSFTDQIINNSITPTERSTSITNSFNTEFETRSNIDIQTTTETNSTNLTLFPLLTKQNYQNFTSAHNKVFFSSVSSDGQSVTRDNETIQLNATVTIDEKTSITNENNSETNLDIKSNVELTTEITTENDDSSTVYNTPDLSDEVTYMSDFGNIEDGLQSSTVNGTDLTFKALDPNIINDKSITTTENIGSTQINVENSLESVVQNNDTLELTDQDYSINSTLNKDLSNLINQINDTVSSTTSSDTLKVQFNVANQVNSTMTLFTANISESSNIFNFTSAVENISVTENFPTIFNNYSTPGIISNLNQSVISNRMGLIEELTTETTTLATTNLHGDSSLINESTPMILNNSSFDVDNKDTISSENERDRKSETTTSNIEVNKTDATTFSTEIVTESVKTEEETAATSFTTIQDEAIISTLGYFPNNLNEFNSPNAQIDEISYTNDNN